MKNLTLPEISLNTLFGPHDINLKHVEALLNVRLTTQGNELIVKGTDESELRVEIIFSKLTTLFKDGYALTSEEVRTAVKLLSDDTTLNLREYFFKDRQQQDKRRRVSPKSVNQRRYLDAIERADIVLGVGPAGTGKTYLAMAQAVNYLKTKRVNRIILARPAVEAGERLGFLPGDLQEKVNPYLRPLYDALYEMLDTEQVSRLIDRGTVEVAPIAFMRGRTLNDAFVILDEAQNTTHEQMKMFLTRLGFGSKAVVTGDITQIDLPSGVTSGLVEALAIVQNIEGIESVCFDERDVVRHKLVQKIVKAYESWPNQTAIRSLDSSSSD